MQSADDPQHPPQFLGRLSAATAARALAVVCGTLVALLLQPGSSSPTRITWPYTGLQQLVASSPTTAPVYDPKEVKVRFSVGGYRGADLFAARLQTSIAVHCVSRIPVRGAQPVPAFGRLSFDPASAVYTYRWAIDHRWRGSCRRLDLQFDDGGVHVVLLRFEDRGTRRRCAEPPIGKGSRFSAAAPTRAAAARSC
jgi:hypothetical protein